MYTLDGVEPIFRDRVQRYFELMLSEYFGDIKENIVEVIVPSISIVDYVSDIFLKKDNEIYSAPSYGELGGKTLIRDKGATVIISSSLLKYGIYDECFKQLCRQNTNAVEEMDEEMINRNFMMQLKVIYHEFTHVRNHFQTKSTIRELKEDKSRDKYMLDLVIGFYDEYLAVYKTTLQYDNVSDISFYSELEKIVSDEYEVYKKKREEIIKNCDWGNLMNVSLKYADEVFRYLANIYGFIIGIKEKYNTPEIIEPMNKLISSIEQLVFGQYFKRILKEILSDDDLKEKYIKIYNIVVEVFEYINVYWNELENGRYYVGIK